MYFSVKTADPSLKLETLITVFDCALGTPSRTRLRGGGEEPLYLPASAADDWACIRFTRDYFSSALHEIAHWCVAGEARRKQVDYGYWYAPDGRNEEQQKRFEKVEVVPQALEWIFSVASGTKFRISSDNLEAQCEPSQRFKASVFAQVQYYCEHGLHNRAADFALALARTFGQENPLLSHKYKMAEI